MLSKEEKQLITIQTIFFFAGSLGGIFLNIFFFKTGGFITVVIFNILQFVFLLIFYLSSGWFLKKISTAFLIQLSLVIFSLSWLTVVILKENSYLLFGILFGIGNGLYWSSYNLSQYLLAQKSKRENYFGKNLSFSNFALAFGPMIGGLIILIGNKIIHFPDSGYYLLFFIIFLLNFVIIFLSSSLPAFYGIKFNLRQIIDHQRSNNWKLVLSQNFLLGLWDVAFGSLSTIILFLIIKNEVSLGTVNTLISFLAAITGFIAGRLMLKNKNLYLMGALMTGLGIFFLGVWQSWLGLVLMGVLTAIGSPFLNIALATAYFNTVDEHQRSWQEKYHLFLERDGILGLARILSYLILYFFFLRIDQITLAKNWLIIISFFPLVIALLLTKMKVTT